VLKIIINNTINLSFKTAISILAISNNNSFRVLFYKIAYVYFIGKLYLHFSTGWLQGSGMVSMLDSGAEGPGSNRSRNTVG